MKTILKLLSIFVLISFMSCNKEAISEDIQLLETKEVTSTNKQTLERQATSELQSFLKSDAYTVFTKKYPSLNESLDLSSYEILDRNGQTESLLRSYDRAGNITGNVLFKLYNRTFIVTVTEIHYDNTNTPIKVILGTNSETNIATYELTQRGIDRFSFNRVSARETYGECLDGVGEEADACGWTCWITVPVWGPIALIYCAF